MGVVVEKIPPRTIVTRDGRKTDLSSVSLADNTCENFSVSLWGHKASWVNNLRVGDITVLERIKVKIFRTERVGNTTYRSSHYVANFDNPSSKAHLTPNPVPFRNRPKSHSWQALAQKLREWSQTTHGGLLPMIAGDSKNPTTNPYPNPTPNNLNSQLFSQALTPEVREVMQRVLSVTEFCEQQSRKNKTNNISKDSKEEVFMVRFRVLQLHLTRGGKALPDLKGSFLTPKDILKGIYVGCSRCESELSADLNGVYCCTKCPLNTPNNNVVTWFYHPAHIQISDPNTNPNPNHSKLDTFNTQRNKSRSIWVQVRHKQMCRLAAAIVPRRISAESLRVGSLGGGKYAECVAGVLNALVRDKNAVLQGVVSREANLDNNGVEVRGMLTLEAVELGRNNISR
ncbi:hypothetical protein AAMO2058_000500100 [Amorphochlora amoebiformis]